MYNQGNHGHRPRMPMLPAYRQQPQAVPPHHFQQATAALPPPPPFVQQVSSLGQASNGLPPPLPPPQMVHQGTSFQVPTSMGQNADRSYAAPSSQVHGSGGLFQNTLQQSQHPLHFGVQGHVRAPPQSYPPPPPEMLKVSTQGHHQLPAPPGGAQNTKHGPRTPLGSFLAPPPPPPPLQSSTLQNTAQLYDSESRPGGEDMNLNGGSNRAFPPPQFSSLPSSAQSSGSEARPSGEGMNLDGGSSVPFAADDKLLSTSCTNMDLPPPPPKPMEEITIQKIEALCKLIAQDGPDVEDKARQNESKNPEFEFLFGGDPGTEAAVVHDYFLWMKRKCILEHRLNKGKNNTLSRYQTADSSEQHDNVKVSSGADSDMEMEDDFTLSEKDQVLDDSVYNLGHKLNTSTQLFGCLSSAEDVSSTEIRSRNESFPESAGLGRKDEGTEILSSGHDMIPTRSTSKFEHVTVGAAETVMTSELERHVSVLADNISQIGSSGCPNVSKTHIHHGELITGCNPIRLSESYASEDNSDSDESSEKNINISTVSPLLAKDSQPACYSEDVDPKSLFTAGKGTGFTSHIDQNAYEIPPYLVKEVKTENQDSVNGTTLSEALGHKDGCSSAGIDADQHNGKPGQGTDENMSKLESAVKVDEFGRLVREGRIDSDSEDDKQYSRKRKPNKREQSRSRSRSRSWSRSRSRSRSRSLSPVGRRWRRRWRSPVRRKEKRSWSRSLSPRSRRKRSRSPLSRRSRDFGGDYIRRNRSQNQDCFDFLRGRCHRGASCRYLHHETDRSTSRRLRERRDFEAPSSSKNFQVPEVPTDISATGLASVHNEHGSQEMHRGQRTTSDGQEMGFSRNHSLDNSMQYSVMDHTRRSGHVSTLEFRSSGEKPEEHNHFCENENLLEAAELPCNAIGGLQNYNRQAQMKDNSSFSVLSPDERSMTAPSKILASESMPSMSSSSQPQRVNIFNSQSLEPPMHSQPPNNLPPSTSMDMSVYPQHLPPAPPFPVQGGGNAVHMQPVSSDYGPIPQAASFPYQSSRGQASMPNQYHQFSVPSNNSWTSFLPLSTQSPYGQNLDPRLAASHTSSQYYQSSMQPRDDHFPQAPNQGPPKSLSQMEASTQNSIPLDNSANQPILPQESHSARSLSFVTAHSQPMHFSWEPAVDNLQPSAKALPKDAVIRSCSPTHRYSRLQTVQESIKYFSAEGTLQLHGEAFSGYPPDPLDQSKPAHMSSIEGSRTSSHHSPFAPVFEQSLGPKSSSNLFRQNMDNQNANNCSAFSSVNCILGNDDGGCGVRPRPVTSSPKSAKVVAQSLLRSGGDQYDPLFDSIEPSNPIRKDDSSQNEEIIGDSDIIAKTRSTYKALDAEENKHEGAGSGAVASTSSLNNGEYGETADAQVGDIESESLSTHVDVANMTTGEVEIDQVASKRKTKDSRSMKLFKVAVANFVKEVLKPSWRQGNMSKVAFKTIVKKTVDKVSGSMKGHHLPKSQAKIDQYIGSSQRKLTKLVMGYVDKYVKV